MTKHSKNKGAKPKTKLPVNIWEWPNGHYAGSLPGGNGFEIKDGLIYLSPGHQSNFAAIAEQRSGVHALLEATNYFAAKRLEEIGRQQSRWFRYVLENIGANYDHEWVYDCERGCLSRKPEQEAGPAQ